MTDSVPPRRKLNTSADADADAPPAKKRRTSTKKTAQTPGKCGMTKKELGDAIHDGLRRVILRSCAREDAFIDAR